jgi:hypothetical protein
MPWGQAHRRNTGGNSTGTSEVSLDRFGLLAIALHRLDVQSFEAPDRDRLTIE